ncbi:MAG: hypothetical protein JWL64_2780 [Frankiales bacterium]|nr:hypothetical protein [Frankiales bacterium]
MRSDLGSIRRWQPDGLLRAADDLARQAAALAQQRERVGRLARDLQEAPWRGAAAAAVAERTAGLADDLHRVAGNIDLLRQVLSGAGAAVAAAQGLLVRALALADAHGLSVLPDGTVRPGPPQWLSGDLPVDVRERVAAAQRIGAEAAADAQTMAVEALAAAREADADAARALRQIELLAVWRSRAGWARLLSDVVSLALVREVTARAVPAAGSAPLHVASWWQALAPEAQARLSGPSDLGRSDGLPAAVRDRLNRDVLSRSLAVVEGALRQARRIDEVARRLGSLDVLRSVQQQLASHPGALLLDLDPEPPGRAVIGLGDVDGAAHLAVVVPGMGSDVHHLGRVVANAQRLQQEAARLSAQYGTGTVAAVAWIGYDAPMSAREVLGEGRAAHGAPVLQRALGGWSARATVSGRELDLTVSAHSYGSVLAGRALREPTSADALVAVGSPGLTVPRAGALVLPTGSVFVGEAPGDVVADGGTTHLFGPDPGAKDFGARQLGLDGKEGLAASHGHSDYYDEGSESLRNQALVVLGRGDLVTGD